MPTPELRYTAYGPTLSGDYTMGELYDGEHTRIIASFNTRVDADRIAAKLNQHAAADTDYLNLFAAYDALKKETAAIMGQRDMALSALDAALDRIDTLNRAALESISYCNMASHEAVNRIHTALKNVAQVDWPFKVGKE